MKTKNSKRIKIFLASILGFALISFAVFTMKSEALTGPSTFPGIGRGAFYLNGQSLGIGGSPVTTSTFTVVGSSTDSSAYSFWIQNSNSQPILRVRNDKLVIVGAVPDEAILPGSSASGSIQATGVRTRFADVDDLYSEYARVLANIDGGGAATISNFTSIDVNTVSGTVSANYVTAGAFGTSSSNYSFPGWLAVATSGVNLSYPKLSVFGGAYIKNNVGIGVTSPMIPLDIAGDGNSSSVIRFRNSSSASVFGEIIADENGVGLAAKNIASASDGLRFYSHNSTANWEVMRITSNGRVGINTTNPQGTLSVSGGVSLGSYAGTTAPPLNGLIVNGTVGIGTPTTALSGPGKLNILADGDNAWAFGGGVNKGIRLEGTSAIEFGGGTGGTLFGMAAVNNIFYIFDTASELAGGISNLYFVGYQGKVGIGVEPSATTTAKLEVNGTTKMTGFQLTTGASDGYVLTANSNGSGTWQPFNLGSGTLNRLAKWNSGGTTLTDSAIYEYQGSVGINTTNPGARLEIVTGGASEGIRLKKSIAVPGSVDMYVAIGTSTQTTGNALCTSPTNVSGGACLGFWNLGGGIAGATNGCGSLAANGRALCADFGD